MSVLAELTTLRLGGPAHRVVTAHDLTEVVAAVRDADAAGEPLLVIGGGSNLVAADDGWPGTVVLIRSRGMHAHEVDGVVTLTVQAGMPWDDVVWRSVESGWSGLAAMSGIPGLAGATPIQNVGAYGSEVADAITGLTVLDRHTGAVDQWVPQQCGFGFRTSAFKHTDRYVVLDVTFRLLASATAPPVHYAEVAKRLGIRPGETASNAAVRDVVLELRRSKGMLLDASDHDTWSVGSFFVNPFVDADQVPADCPSWETGGGIKLSAAWLIENAGFPKGYGHGAVSVSTKHTLALTTRGGATTRELLALAAEIREGVERRFGIRLHPEAHLAGVDF